MEDNKKFVSLSASYTESVLQNKATISLRVMVKEKVRANIQKKLKEKSSEILKVLKEFKDIKSYVSQQSINEKFEVDSNKKVESVGFEGTAIITLIGYDIDVVNKALVKVEEVSEIANIQTSISSTIKKEKEDSITKLAIDAFKAKATLIAEQLGFTKYSIEDITVSGFNEDNFHGRGFGLGMIGGSAMGGASEKTEEMINFVDVHEEKLTVTVSGKISVVLSSKVLS